MSKTVHISQSAGRSTKLVHAKFRFRYKASHRVPNIVVPGKVKKFIELSNNSSRYSPKREGWSVGTGGKFSAKKSMRHFDPLDLGRVFMIFDINT